MKIKSDFITNSSSTSYVVCIPDMKKFVEEMKEFTKKIPRLEIVLLTSKDYINLECLYEYDDYNDNKFYEFHKKVEELGYVLMFIDFGPDDGPLYLNVGYKDNLEKIKKIIGD